MAVAALVGVGLGNFVQTFRARRDAKPRRQKATSTADPTAGQILVDIRDGVSRLSADITDLQGRVRTNTETIDRVQTDVDEMRDEIHAIKEHSQETAQELGRHMAQQALRWKEIDGAK